jgi:hypothetical protein
MSLKWGANGARRGTTWAPPQGSINKRDSPPPPPAQLLSAPLCAARPFTQGPSTASTPRMLENVANSDAACERNTFSSSRAHSQRMAAAAHHQGCAPPIDRLGAGCWQRHSLYASCRGGTVGRGAAGVDLRHGRGCLDALQANPAAGGSPLRRPRARAPVPLPLQQAPAWAALAGRHRLGSCDALQADPAAGGRPLRRVGARPPLALPLQQVPVERPCRRGACVGAGVDQQRSSASRVGGWARGAVAWRGAVGCEPPLQLPHWCPTCSQHRPCCLLQPMRAPGAPAGCWDGCGGSSLSSAPGPPSPTCHQGACHEHQHQRLDSHGWIHSECARGNVWRGPRESGVCGTPRPSQCGKRLTNMVKALAAVLSGVQCCDETCRETAMAMAEERPAELCVEQLCVYVSHATKGFVCR